MLNRPTFGGHISLSGSICRFLLLHPRWLTLPGVLAHRCRRTGVSCRAYKVEYLADLKQNNGNEFDY